MTHALLAIDPLMMVLLIALVGLIARRAGLLSDPLIQGIAQLILYVAQPALMLTLIRQESAAGGEAATFLTVFVVTAVFLSAVQLLLHRLFRRAERRVRPVMTSLSVMANVGFIGVPVVQAVYGQEAFLYLAAVILGFNLSFWTVTLRLYAGKGRNSWKNLLNPTLLSVLLGAALFFLKVRLPGTLAGGIAQISALNTPLSMLLLGARLETLRPRQLLDKRMWLVVALKLLVLPLMLVALLKAVNLQGMALGTLALGMAMPAGTNSQMFAERYDADVPFAVQCISVSTLLCVVTMPVILWATGI
ncbi:MAG: AEC family transporter [Christensenellaceae bacterium]|nr:AEC family transporter [Christensenellaceae bacterium]MEA5066744.1 AEC family transporter [Eubacteriales bacterium]MEA5069673.1 AEC family transporter [Christensenellaceae bacterium]